MEKQKKFYHQIDNDVVASVLFENKHVMSVYGTVKDEPFYDCAESRTALDARGEEYYFSYCVFSIKHVAAKIRKNIPPHRLNILVDATFSTVPANLPYKQILILNAQFFGQVFPFAFALMTHKSEASYKAVFEYVHK